ncbi:ankyrin repeat domain-containing protein [Vibrio sp. LaRot3]|uniref:ankyrin repeat domain-containing protein n=1 Tax=Vibrio sp. LaRot3 TaxID=2998829 RepID=UPI0022CDC5FB|nr:ankyrin repeat domain-containing protein [Vibrio sp. LaRot3]MDA0149069.1 ankyrin repeat domain-containing protein [Vibrio sp. LaRot3]
MTKKSLLAVIIAAGISTSSYAQQEPCDNLDFNSPDRLFNAIEHHCSIRVGEMLRMGDDPNMTDDINATPLIYAAIEDQSLITAQLIEAKAEIDATNDFGLTALIVAARNGSSDATKQLIAAKANPNIIDKSAMTALMYAVKNNHADVVDELLKAKTNVDFADQRGFTALMMASWEGNATIVEKLLAANAAVDVQSTNGYNAQTALIYASEKGHMEVVKQLLKANPRTYIRDNFGKSPLDHAKESGYAEIVNLLEQYQPPAYSSLPKDQALCQQTLTQQEQEPLLYAIDNDCAETVHKLLNEGANPNLVNRYGNTALMMAAANRNPVVAQLLIKAKADVNAAEAEYGSTALMTASSQGSLEVVDLLLKAGVNNIEAKNKWGDTALMKAVLSDHAATVERLVAANASLDTLGRYKLNPLMTASLQSPNTVKYLISIGVDVNEQNKETGETALMIASQRGEYKIITLLTEAGAELDIKSNSGATAMSMARNPESKLRLKMARYEQLVPQLHEQLENGVAISDPEVQKIVKEIIEVAPVGYRTTSFERRYMKDKESMLSLPKDSSIVRRRFY